MTSVSSATALAPPPLLERLLAPGADAVLLAILRDWLMEVPNVGRVLDVGAGARSRLAATGRTTVALDIAVELLAARANDRVTAVAATATALPFGAGTFDAVASVGLLHHLSDADARATVREMLRVTSAGGRLAVFDSILPEPGWRRPLAWAIRRADRGRFVRHVDAVRALLPDPSSWRTARVTYAHTGLEGLWCTRP